MSSVSSTIVSAILASNAAFTQCPILGPDYPRPSGLASDPAFQDVIQNITDTLANATQRNNALYTDLKTSTTSYSIGVFDLYSTLLSFQHTANASALTPDSVQNVTETTVYRVGSVSKLITIYTLLVEVGHAYWENPITDFVPEMAAAAVNCSAVEDPLSCTDWDSITLEALASHLAGVARGHQPTPATGLVNGLPAVAFGLPPAPVENLPLYNSTPCSRTDALRAYVQEPPVVLPFRTPVYSNGAYQLLGYALEKITGRSIKDMMEDDVFAALRMDNSSYSLENGTAGVIPASLTAGWNFPQGDAGAAGGVFSTQNDLVKLGQAIMNSTQLSAIDTRKWMKSLTHTAAWQASVGLAWEIARWEVEGRTVDVYAKQGDFGSYHARFILIPDYEVGVVVLTAGDGDVPAQLALSDTVLSLLVPELEKTAKAQAESNLAGTYAAPSGSLNSSLTLTTEPSLPDLKLASFISNSTDVIANLVALGNKIVRPDVRLYPTLMIRKGENGHQIRKYHAVVQDPSRIYPNAQIRASNCYSWELVDSAVYGAFGIDEYWIETDGDGKAVNIQPRAFRLTLDKK